MRHRHLSSGKLPSWYVNNAPRSLLLLLLLQLLFIGQVFTVMRRRRGGHATT